MQIENIIKIGDTIQSVKLISENKKIEIQGLKNIRRFFDKSNLIQIFDKSNLGQNGYFSDDGLFKTKLTLILNGDKESKIELFFSIIGITEDGKKLLNSEFDFNKEGNGKIEFSICPYYELGSEYKIGNKIGDLIFEYNSWYRTSRYQLINYVDIFSNDELFKKYILQFIFDIIEIN